MGEASENINSTKGRNSLSLQIEKFPRDLLQRFVISSESQASIRSAREDDDDEEEEAEVELNLGLSLGGRFGVGKNVKKLIRASSIAGSMPTFRNDGPNNNTPPMVHYPALIRTSSLPTETEEEWRKRKKLQSLRRMEAKRRRSEKQRSSRVKMEVNVLEEEKKTIGAEPAFGLQRWVRPCYQGSIESRGRSSSSMSELENKATQGIAGASSCGEAGSSGSPQSLQDQGNQQVTCSSRSKIIESFNPLEQEVENKGSGMEDMPCVFTRGDGPNGKRIDGILYKYRKGEEVRIICVCHGNFLSPAEFVKHAGGSDVDHPLRHIVVNPSPAPFC